MKALAPLSPPPPWTSGRAYGLAVLAAITSLAVTRFTWPLFAGTPFVPMFAAVVIATQWGSGRAGLLAIILAVSGAPVAFPAELPSVWEPRTLGIFAFTALIASSIVASRKRAESALRVSEAQLRATWEHAPLGTALLDGDGQVERVNPALESLLGYPSSDCAGMHFTTFNDPGDAAAERQRMGELLGGTEPFYQREQRYRRQDGTLLWGRVTVSAIRESDVVATGALMVLEDVTAQRQADSDMRAFEEKLRQAQKMEAIGQLVAGVAHNFNNLLTVTMGYAELLLARHSDRPVDQSDLQEIHRAAERGATLTRQLLAFGRKHTAMRVRIDLNRTVSSIRDMLTRVIRADIQLTIDVAPAECAIVIDPHDLEQVILNLVINARDALPAGGSIHIDVTTETVTGTTPAAIDEMVAPGEYACLRVRDNGSGMTAHVQAHLFEPFFTTKEVGKGTGLGLPFVHGIAHHGGGFVGIRSAEGEGTTVSVYFPVAPAGMPEAPSEASKSVADHRPAGATILLVEDEAPVSILVATMLKHAGYSVVSAATPGEACAAFEQHGTTIDLLLTDIVMPEMNGPALAQRLVAKRPDLRVLFVSGYSEAMPPGATATRRVGFLAKPFPSHQLVTAVAELLTAHH